MNEALSRTRARGATAVGAAKAEAAAAIARASAETNRARAELATARGDVPEGSVSAGSERGVFTPAVSLEETTAPEAQPLPWQLEPRVEAPPGEPKRPTTLPGVGGPPEIQPIAAQIQSERLTTLPGLGSPAATVAPNTFPDLPRAGTLPGMGKVQTPPLSEVLPSAPVAAISHTPLVQPATPPVQPIAPVVPIAKAAERPASEALPKVIVDLSAEPISSLGSRRVVVEPPPVVVQRAPRAEPLEDRLPALHQDFLAARRRCAESTDDVTFERFANKVRRTRDQIRSQHNCEEVRFEVYVRAGRASLRATPQPSGSTR
jgi:hypothetical protein